ncbi:14541_t:CDS:1, partial [Ambispora leptoticha]
MPSSVIAFPPPNDLEATWSFLESDQIMNRPDKSLAINNIWLSM